MTSEQSANPLQAQSPTKGIFAALVLGCAGALILSFAYVPLCHYIPIVYLIFLITLGFGYVVGEFVKAGIKAGRIDKPFIALVTGGIVGLFAIWVSWLAYFWLYYGYDFGAYWHFLLRPWDIISGVIECAHDPLWSLGKSKGPEPAFFYYTAWLGEALLLIGLIAAIPWKFVKNNQLCADCRKWLKATGEQAILAATDINDLKNALESGRMDALLSLSKAMATDTPGASWLEATVFACPDCSCPDSFVTIRSVVIKQGKKKDETERDVSVVAKFVPMTPADREKLLSKAFSEIS